MKAAQLRYWALPALLTAIVVSFRAGDAGLWRDEIASWSAATRPVGEIIAMGRNIDGVLVPYYLFLHAWIGVFGDSVLAMRVPSIIAMTATAAVVALLARRWWGESAGLLAGLLFAVVPAVSRYGQEIRGYAPAALFVMLATLLLTIALDRSRWWTWSLYAGCVTLAGLSHLLSLLVLTGHAVLVLVVDRRRAPWWALAAALGLGTVLLAVRSGLGQQSAQLNWLHPADFKTLTELPGSLFEVPVLGGAVCALALGARRSPAAILWAAVLLPVGLLFGYDHWRAPIFVPRYLLYLVPLLCVLAGAALAALRRPVALAAVLALGLIGLPSQQSIRRAHSPWDYRAAADVLLDHQVAGDGIVYAPRADWSVVDLGLSYYLRSRAPRDLLVVRDERANASLWATECATCLSGTQRIWVVAADNIDPSFRATDTNQLAAATRTALAPYHRSASYRVSGFTVTLFAAPLR
ncbi:glycosyltransferase family 39 protein [Paractinoplanes ferrugineus]|uniref:glycosyltransferase family 39 protein n=1 Tax=Paractinoplanes ferrugineus TaxID=113564 RepID=UPI001EF2876D|nr:glycosyltransferase family 39 protein [Actinoplanes ferrugineus]